MVTLYSTGCPRCKVLKAKLKQKGIEFKVIDSEEVMRELGMTEVPMLVTDDEIPFVLNFQQAIGWVNRQ